MMFLLCLRWDETIFTQCGEDSCECTPLTMELDTGAAVSLVSESVWKRVKGPSKLYRSDMVLRTYNSCLTVLGEAKVRVQYA